MTNHQGLERLRSAGILINVYPAGKGKVRTSVENVGPLQLQQPEMLVILRNVVRQMEAGRGEWAVPEGD